MKKTSRRDRRQQRQAKLKLRGTSTPWPPPWATLPDSIEAIERGEKAAPRPAEQMMLVPIGGALVAVPCPPEAARGHGLAAAPQDGPRAVQAPQNATSGVQGDVVV